MCSIEAKQRDQIIKSVAIDFKNEFLNSGKEGIRSMFRLIYGDKDISDQDIDSLQKHISKHSYHQESKVITKLNSLLNEQPLNQYADNNGVLTDLFNQQTITNGIDANHDQNVSNSSNKNILNHSNDNNSNNIHLNQNQNQDNKIVFTEQIKSQKSRITQTKKSIYSSQVDQLIEKMKKSFWSIDMERIGSISQKEDLKDFLSSLKEEFDTQRIEMSEEEIYQTICKLLNVSDIDRIEIDQVEKIIVFVISNQIAIPLYKI